MQQQCIGANVAEEDAIVGAKGLDCVWEGAGCDVRGLVVDRPAVRFERRDEPGTALIVFGGGEAVEALLMDGVGRPRFPGDQYALVQISFPLLRGLVTDWRSISSTGSRVSLAAGRRFITA